MEKYLNEKEVAKMTSISVVTLRNNRCIKRGFPYIKVGKSVRYSYSDIVEYMENRKVMPEVDDV